MAHMANVMLNSLLDYSVYTVEEFLPPILQ
jgi:hypothetical protein